MFNVNFDTVIAWLTPKSLRKAVFVGYLKAILTPLKTLYAGATGFSNYRNQNIYKLEHTGQVCYLEDALNDRFDPQLRRIYIQDAGGEVVTLIHRRTDEEPVIIQPRTDPALLIHNRSAYDGGNFDFIVKTPYTYSQGDIYAMRALVDYYKLAGKRYDIN